MLMWSGSLCLCFLPLNCISFPQFMTTKLLMVRPYYLQITTGKNLDYTSQANIHLWNNILSYLTGIIIYRKEKNRNSSYCIPILFSVRERGLFYSKTTEKQHKYIYTNNTK